MLKIISLPLLAGLVAAGMFTVIGQYETHAAELLQQWLNSGAAELPAVYDL